MRRSAARRGLRGKAGGEGLVLAQSKEAADDTKYRIGAISSYDSTDADGAGDNRAVEEAMQSRV